MRTLTLIFLTLLAPAAVAQSTQPTTAPTTGPTTGPTTRPSGDGVFAVAVLGDAEVNAVDAETAAAVQATFDAFVAAVAKKDADAALAVMLAEQPSAFRGLLKNPPPLHAVDVLALGRADDGVIVGVADVYASRDDMNTETFVVVRRDGKWMLTENQSSGALTTDEVAAARALVEAATIKQNEIESARSE